MQAGRKGKCSSLDRGPFRMTYFLGWKCPREVHIERLIDGWMQVLMMNVVAGWLAGWLAVHHLSFHLATCLAAIPYYVRRPCIYHLSHVCRSVDGTGQYDLTKLDVAAKSTYSTAQPVSSLPETDRQTYSVNQKKRRPTAIWVQGTCTGLPLSDYS